MISLDKMTPYWWVDHVSTVFSIPLALAGFTIAIWQLAKTRKAADAARRAAVSALEQVQRLNLVGLLPQLSRIDDEIDRAVQVQSTEILRFWISQWKWQAGGARGYLNPSLRDEEKVMRLIQSSIVAASDVRRALHTVAPDQLVTATADLRRSISKVTSELGMLAARQSSVPEGE